MSEESKTQTEQKTYKAYYTEEGIEVVLYNGQKRVQKIKVPEDLKATREYVESLGYKQR